MGKSYSGGRIKIEKFKSLLVIIHIYTVEHFLIMFGEKCGARITN